MANLPGYKEKVYLDVSKTSFKVCYGNHKKLFTKQHHKNDTELYQGVLESKTTKGNTQNKVESVKEMSRL